MRRLALSTKVVAAVVIAVGALVTIGYFMQYRHAVDTLDAPRLAVTSAQKAYNSASDDEAIASGNAAAAKAAYVAQQKFELELSGTTGPESAALLGDVVKTRNAEAAAEATLSDAAGARNDAADAFQRTEAYVDQTLSQLQVSGIVSGVCALLAVVVAFSSSIAASKAHAMVALASLHGDRDRD
jgi:hypothetical protein